MDKEGTKTKSSSHRNYLILSGIIIFLLIIFIIIDYVFIIRRSKVLAPEKNVSVNTNTNPMPDDNSRFDKKTEAPSFSDSTPTPKVEEGNQTAPETAPPDLPTDPEYYYNQGISLTSQGKYSEAIISFQKAIEINPKNPVYYQKKAETEVLAGDKNAAISTIQAGIAQNPDDVLLKNKLEILQTVVR